MTARDTSPAAQRVQVAAFGAMTGGERVQLAAAMAEQAKAIALSGIRARHPDLDEIGVHQAWLRLVHGPRAEHLIQRAAPGCS